ncbi:MAG: 50S ribosomal protein L13 [Anaerolineae bacterium]|nr:50S ribosomal protein L13 [Anaerolineae bacterium]
MVEKTYVIKGKPEANWVLIDAEGETLGRLATRIAATLMGKHKPDFTPGATMGDSVIVINAKGIQANPTRVKEKIYYRHSNYPGGLKAVTYTDQLANHPDRIIKIAVKGMLPHNRYGRELMKRLRVFAGAEHPHKGQQPKKLDS